MWKRVKQTFSRKPSPPSPSEPRIVPSQEHGITPADISPNALRVLNQLNDNGFQACLVGGGVRDLLLGREPKDFDVATDATPEQVRELFRNCRLIGRRFRLAHVRFGREIIEVATFRGGQDAAQVKEAEESGRLLRDNSFGTIDEDARRRDFSINSLYYNVADSTIIDYANGLADLRAGHLRLLGDPAQRFREDPVRMIRAVRFAAKLGFVIDEDCDAAILESASLMENVPAARLFDEVLKLFMGGAALTTFEKLRHYDLFRYLFGETDTSLSRQEHDFPLTFVHQAMENTDSRLQVGKNVSPFFLFAALLWEPVRILSEELVSKGEHPVPAMQQASSDVLQRQIRQVSIPKRVSMPMRDVWHLQFRFTQRNGKRPRQLLTHPRFRAGYDFLLLRAEAGEIEQELADWWTGFIAEQGDVQPQQSEETPRRRPRRRRRRPPKRAD